MAGVIIFLCVALKLKTKEVIMIKINEESLISIKLFRHIFKLILSYYLFLLTLLLKYIIAPLLAKAIVLHIIISINFFSIDVTILNESIDYFIGFILIFVLATKFDFFETNKFKFQDFNLKILFSSIIIVPLIMEVVFYLQAGKPIFEFTSNYYNLVFNLIPLITNIIFVTLPFDLTQIFIPIEMVNTLHSIIAKAFFIKGKIFYFLHEKYIDILFVIYIVISYFVKKNSKIKCMDI